jgi:acetylornithine/N-succinyldiaminopimelate aminotransferase
VVAVFLETIQGEGGITPARMDYLQGLRRCAMSRTGC